MDKVRVCLNDNHYTQPSGGYKAHSQSMKGANSHMLGVGLEEWINSPINVLKGKDWKAQVGIQPFKDGNEPEAEYRVAFLEAFRCVNYPESAKASAGDVERGVAREVMLVRNDGPNLWGLVGHIQALRGLTPDESFMVYDYFARNGVIDLMNQQMKLAHRVSMCKGIPYGAHPMLPLHGFANTRVPADTFTCIFKVADLRLCPSPQVVAMAPGHDRYTRRY